LVVDGRSSQVKRGQMAKRFKSGFPKVMLAGAQAMALGHSFSKCANVIQTACDWSLDTYKQAPERCRRLDSEADLNHRILICEFSIDAAVMRLLDEKDESAQLAIDGEDAEEYRRGLDLETLRRETASEFASQGDSPDERELLVREWPPLLERLSAVALKHKDNSALSPRT
jgi:hypothetical protein